MRRSIILAGAVVLLCSACSGSGAASKETKRPAAGAAGVHDAAVQAAVGATTKSSARIDEQVEWTDGTRGYTVIVKGGFDLASGKGRLTAKIPGQSTIGPYDEIFTRDTVYLRMPLEINDDPAWWSVSRDKVETHNVLRAPVNDPEHVLRQVARMRETSKVGEEQVDGAPTVRYRGKLDNETLTLRLTEDRREEISIARKGLGSDLPASADVWIDRSGRVARIRFELIMGTGSVTTTMYLTDHGKPVEAPVAPGGAKPLPLAALGGPLTG
ncbi:hypothetical protein [Streptomyces olivoreticuli]|uniref:hypothetical protein n=1 Tax=Streptomyces olivoreticuli TaxID=68246 RepID=UPI0013C2C9F5|nr:hypothetical protein [Streptomyces olivoreticuli]